MKFMSKEELLDVIAFSDLYVHCAESEIEGMSCIEAFSAGLVPVIADSPCLLYTSLCAPCGNIFVRSPVEAVFTN